MTVENSFLSSPSKSLLCFPYASIMCDPEEQPSLSSSASSTCENLWDEQSEISFHNLKTVPVPGCHFALKNVTGVAKPGQILAVMGPTGCGKTTLLNTISGRVQLSSGSIWVNGQPISRRLRRTRVGYVLQHDIFFPTLTLKQTLIYTALLRLSDVKYSNKEKIQKVEDIIEVLNLYKCQHNPIGDNVSMGGLSGGERKRLSIACELITNPSVLLLDEATSGLDSFTANHLIKTLKNYVQKTNKNVILTVHQPSSRMFQMFDSLLAMSNGQTAYFGPASEMTSHMASLDLVIENNYNPADFLLEKLKYDEQKVLKAWHNKSQKEIEHNQLRLAVTDADGGDGNDDRLSGKSNSLTLKKECSWQTSFFTQVSVLTRRNIQLALPNIFATVNVVQTLLLALLAGFTWFQTERTEENLENIAGWMFFSSHFWMLFVLFRALWAFPPEKPVIANERRAGAYRFSSYYISKVFGELPLELVLPSVYLIISYPMMGGTVAAFSGILLSHLLSSIAAQSVGLFFGACLSSGPATTAASVFTVGAQLLGGFLTTNIPTYVKIFSLVYNGLRNMQIIEYHYGNPVLCATSTESKYPSCRNNETFISPMDLLKKDETGFIFPLWTHAVVLVAFIVIFRVLAYVCLKRNL